MPAAINWRGERRRAGQLPGKGMRMERLTAAEGLAGPHAPIVFVEGLDALPVPDQDKWRALLRYWPFLLIGDGGWEIEIWLVPELKNRGEITIHINDRKATLTVWIRGADSEQTLVHELAHILLQPLLDVAVRPAEHLREPAGDLHVTAACCCMEESAVRLADAILMVDRLHRAAAEKCSQIVEG